MGEEVKNKRRGQITIFIIVGILIVALGVLIYLFYPQISSTLFGGGAKSPSETIQGCLEPTLKEQTDLISAQGGSLSHTHYFYYRGDRIQYLCYTN